MCFRLLILFLMLSFPDSTKLQSQLNSRIRGSHTVSIEEAPHHVAILLGEEYVCGGSIIADDAILTAAHCFADNNDPAAYIVKAGTNSFHDVGNRIKVKNFTNHELYSNVTVDFDISIVHLQEPIKYNETMKAIQMIDADQEIKEGTKCIIFGWGEATTYNCFSQSGGSWPLSLKNTTKLIPVYNQTQCENIYSKENFNVTSNMFCAGSSGYGACLGDDGGALVCDNKLTGISLWGLGCGEDGFPSIYTNVAALRKWIDKNIKP